MADGSIADTSSKFSKESSSSSSLSSFSPNDSSSNDESNLSSSTSNDLSSDDKRNQDEKSDDNASAEDRETKHLDGLEINLERCHEWNIGYLPLDKNAAQIAQKGHPLAKKLPLWLNLRPSACQRLIYHSVFTSFQCHGPVSVEALDKVKEVIFDIKLLKVTRPNTKQQPCCKGKSNGCIMDKINPFYKMRCPSFKMTMLERVLCLLRQFLIKI